MKILFLFTIAFCLISINNILFAQSISVKTANEIAKNQLLAVRKDNLKSASKNPINFSLSSVSVDVSTKDSLYYVLSDTINNGFVIVAADKRAWPILGYSLDGKFSESNQPPAFIDWMEQRKQEISYIKKNNLPVDGKTTQQWDNLSSSNSNSSLKATLVEPLLQTTWDQGCYYNSLCPSDLKGQCGHVWTGCVATSMAQIMKYWSYPTTGTGSHSYSHSTYGTLSADFGSTTYQWSQMPNNVTSENSAVATLMYHCGVSVDMNYSADGSSASYSGATLINYFKYSASAEYVYKSNYSSQEWENLLKFELNSNRPIWYRGEGWSGGHAFVCDGYRNTGDFHFNWGWGGYADGYFYMGNLNPSDKSYNDNQGAVIRIFPSSTPNAVGPITGNTVVCQGQTAVNYSVVAISNAASYIWTLPNGATGTSTTNSINVDFGNTAQSGILKVRGQNASGDGPESSLTITVNLAPGATGTITGNKMVCPGVSELYSVTPVSGAISYTWVLPSGWTGSSTSTSITVIPGNSNGTISVNANNSSCSGPASQLNVTNGVPNSPTGATASQTTIIAGQSTILQVVGGNLNSAPNWVWYTGNCGGTPVGNGITLSVSPLSTTTYYVQATGCGVSTTCRSVTINVCIAPAAPKTSSASIGSPANGSNHYLNFSVESVSDADGYSWDYSWDGINWQINWYQNYYTSLYWSLNDQPNIPVYFRVRAYKCSPKQYSNYTYTLPQPIYTACDDPATPAISGITSNSLNITLNAETPVANPIITTYSIYCVTTSQYIQTNGELGSTEVFQTKSSWGTKTVTGLLSNKEYCFYAKARNNDGNVQYNSLNSVCKTTLSGSPVANFSATPINDCAPLTVSFTDESLNNPTSWAWDIDNNGVVDYTAKNPIHAYNTPGTYSVKLTVTNGYGSNSKTITNYITANSTVSPKLSINTSPSTTIIFGQLVSFTATPTYGGVTPKYQWKVDDNNVGINSPTYNTSILTNGQVVSCVMTSNSPCASTTTATSNTITVNVLPANAGTITGTTPVCQGQNSATYSVPTIANATSYIWTLPNGAIGTSITNSITVNFGSSAVSGNITVKGHNTCGDGSLSTLAVTVNLLPAVAGIITGTTSVCQGQNSVTYTVPAIANATSYIWTLPNGTTGTSVTNSITVNYGTTAVSGNITVKGHNDCGDGGISTISITVNPLPASAGIITGSTTVCTALNLVSYTVPAIANASAYVWALPAGATGTSTTNSITVNYGTSAVSGNISVKGHNDCGDGVASTLAITVNTLPTDAGTITGTSTICQGQNSVTYTVPAITNAASYIWTLPSGASGISTTNSISVNYGTSAVSGNITAKGHNDCGDGGISTISITVNPKPVTPIVTLNGNILHSNASNGNQWYNQNVSINGATNQDYTFAAIGDYSVIVTFNGCASEPSTVNVVTGFDPNKLNQSVKVYPNPVTNELIIELKGNIDKTDFEILNSIGRVVFEGNLFEKAVIQTTNFSPGLYIVKLKSGKTFEFRKIVKL